MDAHIWYESVFVNAILSGPVYHMCVCDGTKSGWRAFVPSSFKVNEAEPF